MVEAAATAVREAVRNAAAEKAENQDNLCKMVDSLTMEVKNLKEEIEVLKTEK